MQHTKKFVHLFEMLIMDCSVLSLLKDCYGNTNADLF